MPQGPSNFSFSVDDGVVNYDTDCSRFLEGHGTDTLVLKGYAVTIDARYLTGPGLIFWGVLGYGASDPKGNGDTHLLNRTCQLLPGADYYFVVASGMYGDFSFTLEKDGSIFIDNKFLLFSRLQNGNTIIIEGFPMIFDGVLNGANPTGLFGIYGLLDSPFADNHTPWSYSKVITGNFMPTLPGHGFFPMMAYGGKSGVSKEGFRVSVAGDVIVSDATYLNTDIYNGTRRVQILRDLEDRLP